MYHHPRGSLSDFTKIPSVLIYRLVVLGRGVMYGQGQVMHAVSYGIRLAQLYITSTCMCVRYNLRLAPKINGVVLFAQNI